MRILLTNPANAGILRAVGLLFPPMGLLSLGAYLERAGYRVEVRDFCHTGERPDYYYTRSKKAMQEVWQLAKRHKLGMGTIFTFIKDYFWGK